MQGVGRGGDEVELGERRLIRSALWCPSVYGDCLSPVRVARACVCGRGVRLSIWVASLFALGLMLGLLPRIDEN
jgi:hypothetical protein